MRLPSRVELDRDEVRRGGLYAFLRLAWPLIEPSTAFIGGWHLELICRHLEAVSRGELRRLVINIPPGMGKSTLICVAWCAWDWIDRPDRRFFFCSYSQRLSRRDSERTNALVTSGWYEERWSTRVDHDRTETKDDFSTTGGGQRFCTTTDGQATGWHPHIKVADDPNPPKDAAGGRAVTKAALAEVAEFWTGTMGSRGDPDTVAEVIVQQRVHEADLSGVLLEAGGCTHLRLPMEYDPEEPCETSWGRDPRTEEGELLCEERRGREAVAALKRALRTPANVAAQLDQRPQARGGGTFKGTWLRRYRELPHGGAHGYWIHAWDCNFGVADSPDFVVGSVWCQLGSDCYLVDQVRGRWDLWQTLEEIRGLAKAWPRAITKLVEARANGPAVVQLLERELVGLVAVNQGNKETRAHSAAAMWEAGNVLVPEHAPWVEAWIAEHVGWPHGRHDDQVDAAAHALVHLGEHDVSGYGDFVRGLKASGIASR